MAQKQVNGISCLSANLTFGAILRSHGRSLRRIHDRVLEESVLKKLGFRVECKPALSPQEQKRLDDALLASAISGSLADMNAALGAGANPDARAANGWTPLMLAIWNEHLPLAKRLAMANADVNAKGNEGRTAAMLAACNRDGTYLSWIITMGRADLGETDNAGWSALMLAAKENLVQNIRQLKFAGKGPERLDIGRALDVARKEGCADAARELEARGVPL